VVVKRGWEKRGPKMGKTQRERGVRPRGCVQGGGNRKDMGSHDPNSGFEIKTCERQDSFHKGRKMEARSYAGKGGGIEEAEKEHRDMHGPVSGEGGVGERNSNIKIAGSQGKKSTPNVENKKGGARNEELMNLWGKETEGG